MDSEDRLLEGGPQGLGLFDNFIIDNPEYAQKATLTERLKFVSYKQTMIEKQKNSESESFPHLFDPQVVKIIGELIAIDLSNMPCGNASPKTQSE